MKPFVFKQFTVKQSDEVFRVGTDAVLLGALCNCSNISSGLEVGCGTGIISLMVAQRNPNASLVAIDINKTAAELSSTNFQQSVFAHRLTAVHADFKNFIAEDKFDFIVCNPPYFEQNSSTKDVIARQKTALDFHDLTQSVKSHLKSDGLFSVIIPAEATIDFAERCTENSLFLRRRVDIFGIKNGPVKRVLLEFSDRKSEVLHEKFVVEESARKYSLQYLAATRDFHVFGKSVK